MKQLRWSDNTCSVGWTSIWAMMTAHDMDWLREMHPKGYFTNTFYYSIARVEDWPEVIRKLEKDITGDPHFPFYFTFPEDAAGCALLAALRMMGMTARGE